MEPVCNAIVWQCRRTSNCCEELKKNKDEVKLFKERTGFPIDAYFSASKIEWILKNVSHAMSNTEKGKLLFGTADTWILRKLTGGAVHATDYTNASRTMLFDIEERKWDGEILKKFGITRQVLPQVMNSSGTSGKTIKIGKLRSVIPVSGVAGDQQASFFGQVCFEL